LSVRPDLGREKRELTEEISSSMQRVALLPQTARALPTRASKPAEGDHIGFIAIGYGLAAQGPTDASTARPKASRNLTYWIIGSTTNAPHANIGGGTNRDASRDCCSSSD
jgi:hypothetical protein